MSVTTSQPLISGPSSAVARQNWHSNDGVPADVELDAILDAETSELDELVRLHEQTRTTNSSSPIYEVDDDFELALQSLVSEGALDSMDIS